MRWLWRLFGFQSFTLPKQAKLIQTDTLCDQTAIALAIEADVNEEKWCPMSRFTFFVLPGEFEGQYGGTVVSEVRRFKANWIRKSRVHIKISANHISQSTIMALIYEAQRD